ncbi:titin, partial [Biomphalaria glabrata]
MSSDGDYEITTVANFSAILLLPTLDNKRQDNMKDIDRSLSLRRGSEKGTSKLVSGQLGRRASEYSPVIGGRSGPKISPAQSAVSYKGITSLTELQNLLTHTEDSNERNNIRNVIRHLRQLPESEQLKKGKPGLEKSSAGVGHAREPGADVKRSTSTFLPSTSSPTRTQSLRTSGSRSSNGLKLDNGSSHEPAPSPSSASVSSFSLTTNSPSSSVKASQSSPRQNNNNSARPKPTVRQSLAAKSDHSKSHEDKTYNDNLEGSKASDASKVSQKTDLGAESSSVLEQVKAKLESRRNSSNNELKTPDHLRSTLTKSLATPLETPSSDDVFSFPESKKTQDTSEDQNLRRGSTGGERYREARHHILKLSGLTYGQKPSLTTDHLSPTAEVKADIVRSIEAAKSPHEIKTLTNEKSIKNSDSPLSTHSSKGQSKQGDDLDAEYKTSPQSIIPKAVGSVTDKKEPLHKQIPPDELLNLSDSSGKPVSHGVKDDVRKTGQLSHVTNEEQKRTPKTSTISTLKSGAVPETPVKRTRSLYTPGKSSLDSRNKNVDLTDMSTIESVVITARAICEKPTEDLKQSDSDTSGETVMPVLNLVSNNQNDHLDSVKPDSVLNTTQKMEPILHTVGVTIASETVELPSKPTLTRSRPVGRSLTESRTSRPEMYRDDRFLARIDENAELHKDNSVEMHQHEPQQEILQHHEPQQEIPQPVTRQRKVGVIMTGAPPAMESKPDITEDCQVARHPGYGLRLAPQEPEGSHLNSLLRDFQLQKPVDEESLVARMKRFSAPAPNYVQMQVASSHLDDQSKRRHSEIYNKQEAIKIEQAFSSLLEDLEVVSGSESNISDHEHSESDDSLASSHESSASLDSSYQTLKTLGNKELPSSLPSKSEEQNNEPLTSYQHHDLTSTHHTDITTSDKVKDYHKDGLSSMSQEDSGIALSPEELPQKQDNVDRSNLAEESQPAADSRSASSASQETCTDLTDGAIMTGERLDQSEPHSAMETISSHSSTTTAVLQLAPTPQISQETIGTRTFRVNQDKDGGITLQASAEDENQNRVVTVRTLKQRTPSDADEELRDKIVQKKMVSPGGTVLEEKAVVQTKKKLTSRGSNYYTRSTYTTRTKRDKHGQETVEHNVSVETENKSVSQGQSWGNKVVTSVTLDEGGNPVLSENENDRKTDAKLAITNKADGAGEVSGIAPSLTAVSPTEMIKAIASVKVE